MRTGNAPDSTAAEKRLMRINVLVVISSQKAAELIRSLFIQLGFRDIFIAIDASEAVQILREIDINLIVADADLKISREGVSEDKAKLIPGKELNLSGVQFIQRLRHAPNSPTPFIPVLMLMDRAQQDQILIARDAGVNDIVLKPMEARDFCQRVIQVIDKPRNFITSTNYKGPCRRRKGSPPNGKERRVREVKLVRCEDIKGNCT